MVQITPRQHHCLLRACSKLVPHYVVARHTVVKLKAVSAVGSRIRRARERAVWWQAELTRAAGISAAGLWQIEHGNRQPRPATFRKIAAVLGVDPSELLRGPDADILDEATGTRPEPGPEGVTWK